MQLKVSDGAGGWHILDQVRHVHLLPRHKWTVRSLEDLRAIKIDEQEPINLVAKEALKGAPIDIGLINFERNGQQTSLIFTDIAYVMNDDGKTTDKLAL